MQIETKKVRSILTPRWWQIRQRFRFRRMRRDFRQIREELSPMGQRVYDEMNKEIEYAVLFGDTERR